MLIWYQWLREKVIGKLSPSFLKLTKSIASASVYIRFIIQVCFLVCNVCQAEFFLYWWISERFSYSVLSNSATPWTVTHQAPLSMEFCRQEYWSGLPFPPPGDLPDPGIQSTYSALQADSLPSKSLGKPSIDESIPLNEEIVEIGKKIWIWKFYTWPDFLGKFSYLSCSTGAFNFIC